MESVYWCSLASIVFTAALTLWLRSWWSGSRHYQLLNEFACSLLWVSWRLEMLVVSLQLGGGIPCLLANFLLIFSQPYLYDTACANPASLLVCYLKGHFTWKRAACLLLCQVASVPVALSYALVTWQLFAYASPPHGQMPTAHTAPLLQVTPLAGFSLELIGTFLSFTTPTFMTRPGVVKNAAVAGTFTALELAMGGMTGAAFNPLPISAFLLLLRRHHVSELLLVYWAGALAGAFLAWQVLMKQKPKSI